MKWTAEDKLIAAMAEITEDQVQIMRECLLNAIQTYHPGTANGLTPGAVPREGYLFRLSGLLETVKNLQELEKGNITRDMKLTYL